MKNSAENSNSEMLEIKAEWQKLLQYKLELSNLEKARKLSEGYKISWLLLYSSILY
jgi:hypothetical protein